MDIDFSGIKHEPGAAIYLIDDGSSKHEREMDKLEHSVAKLTKRQIIRLSKGDDATPFVLDAFKLRGERFVIIVRDNDELYHMWTDGEHFDASQIAYYANHAS